MDNLGFNMFDAVVIGLILLLSLKGLLSGFTKELFNAIGLIGGLFVASYYKSALATYLHKNFLSSLSMPLLDLISILAIFLAVYIAAKLVYKIIEAISKKDYISGASRLGGMLVKMITLFFVFSLIVLGLSSKPQVVNKFQNILNGSKLYPLLKSSGELILDPQGTLATTPKANKTDKKEANATIKEPTKEVNNTKEETKKEIKAAKQESNKSNITHETTKEHEDNATQKKENKAAAVKEENKEEEATHKEDKEENQNTHSTNENNTTQNQETTHEESKRVDEANSTTYENSNEANSTSHEEAKTTEATKDNQEQNSSQLNSENNSTEHNTTI